MADDLHTSGLNLPELNRAGRRAAEKRARHKRAAGAALAAGAATFSTTAALLGVGVTTAGAANMTVTSLLDDGDGTCDATCTLRDAVGDVGAGETITFDPSLAGTITLTGGDIELDKSMTIQGPGASVITVDGNDSDRIFDVNLGAPATIVISGLTLTNGSDSNGGAISLDDELNITLRDMVITDNVVTGDGGAIGGEDNDIHLVIENSTITGNSADGNGGAIYLYSNGGSITIRNSTISGNTAGDGGGGAIYAKLYDSPTGLVIDSSTLSGNSASADGGAIDVYWTPTTITNTTISGNTAGGGGGGVMAYYNPGNLTIANSTISGNSAGGWAGGLYVYWVDGNVDITNTTISGNTAVQGGGGVWMRYVNGDSVNIVGSTISGNTAGSWAGGLYLAALFARTTIAFSTIDQNQAGNDGGGVLVLESDVFRVLNSTISGNTAGDNGGGLYLSRFNYDVAEIFNSTISGNTAASDGGGIWFGSYYGLQIAQATITGNTATNGGGLFIYCFEEPTAEAKSMKAKSQNTHVSDGVNPRIRVDKSHPVKENKVRAQSFGEVSASGTIIAGNANDDVADCGTLTADHSLLGTIVGTTLAGSGNIVGQLPLVAPLANNGGPTQTHALLPDSPAINAGPVPVADFEGNQNDQRGEGFPRVVAGVVDIGAYEVQPPQVNFTG